jgi:hypothetical protein
MKTENGQRCGRATDCSSGGTIRSSALSEQNNSEGQALAPRAQTRRPVAVRTAAKKCKALEFDEESEYELKRRGRPRYALSYCAFVHRCSYVMCFAESKAQPHLILYRPWQGVHCSLVSGYPLHCLDHRSSILVLSCLCYTFKKSP